MGVTGQLKFRPAGNDESNAFDHDVMILADDNFMHRLKYVKNYLDSIEIFIRGDGRILLKKF